MQKPRILFIGEGVTLSHIIRPLILAKALNKNDYEVIFASDQRYKTMIEKEGFVWKEIPSMPPDVFLAKLSNGKPLFSYQEIKRFVEADIELLSTIKPNLVVGDFRVSLGISTQITKTPYACLNNVHWSPFSALNFPLPELPINKFLPPTIIKIFFQCFSGLFLSSHTKGFNQLKKEYGLPIAPGIKSMYTEGTWTIYLDIPSIVPVHTLPHNHFYLGPVCEMLDVSLPKWWGQWPADKPIIYLSFGSSGNIELIDLLKSTLKEMDVTVLVTTSGRYQDTEFPENFYVTDYLSGLEVAQIAQVFIINGGTGAIYQALTYGVPILGLPSNMDQFFLMGRLEHLGAGILIRPSRATKKNISSAITKLLENNSYKEFADSLSKNIQQFNTKERFKKFIDSKFEKGGHVFK